MGINSAVGSLSKVMGPLCSEYVDSNAFSASIGVHKLMRPIFSWRINWVWYAFALLFWPALTFVSNLIGEFVNIPANPVKTGDAKPQGLKCL